MNTNATFKRVLLALVVVLLATQAKGANAEPQAPDALTAPSNIACLPFAQSSITAYNGNKVTSPINSDFDFTFVTWLDNADSETGFLVERQEVGQNSWSDLATVGANTNFYVDDGLDIGDDFRYRVRAVDGNSEGSASPACRRPKFVDGSNGNFRLFYRPYSLADCPNVVDDDGDSNSMCSTEESADRTVEIMENVRSVLISLNFIDPLKDKPVPMPVDFSLCDGVGCSLTYNGNSYITLRPSTHANAYDPATGEFQGGLWTPLHETFHKVQRGLADPNKKWVTEGQARSMQDKICFDPMPQDGQADCTLSLDLESPSNYVNEVNDYLADVNRPLTEVKYEAALFWTYMSEHYGSTPKEPQLGVDWHAAFWLVAGASENSDDAFAVISETQETLGWNNVDFLDAYKDFMVANYAKDVANAPAKYKYVDETQPPGNPANYTTVTFSDNQTLAQGAAYLLPSDQGLEFISKWGGRYYRFDPDAAVDSVNVVAKTLDGSNVYFTLLAVKNGNIVDEVNDTDDEFFATVQNDNLDEVVLVVAGLETNANISLAVNATEPVLRIVNPLGSRKALAGDPAKPEKILVQVEVLDTEAAPMAGLDLDGFSFTIGNAPVPPDQIISSAYIQGEYWTVLRAPAQAGPGTFGLQVEHTIGLSDTMAASVTYDTAIETDNVVVIDRSFSMVEGGSTKLQAAKDAGRLYVDSWEEGDKIGVVSYSGAAKADLTLRDWDDDSRTDAFSAINGLNGNGNTAIGVALLLGLNQLETKGRAAAHIGWAMILLSDGEETVTDPKSIDDFVSDYKAKLGDGDKLPQVHVVALGADADQATLQDLASDTGGTYHFAGEPAALQASAVLAGDVHNDLAEIYRVIGETILREQQVYSARGLFDSTQSPSLTPQTHTIQVDGSAAEAVFVFNWIPSGDFELTVTADLIRPNGSDAGPPTRVDGRHLVWRVANPTPGDWKVEARPILPGVAAATAAGTNAGAQVDYLVEASLKSDLVLNVFLGLAPRDRVIGQPMPIYVSLSDTEPLVGANVQAQLIGPSGVTYNVTLFDDGNHGDGAEGDGFYATTFNQTYVPGVYQLAVTANGNSPLNGAFKRRVLAAFFMQGLPDTDNDGIPDRWEGEHGTDPDRPDGDEDPDQDSVPNSEENRYNTHPFNPDSDNGGESDRSEIDRGSDPLDPIDDLLSPARWQVYAGSGRVWLGYSVNREHRRLQIYRALGRAGLLELIDELTDLTANVWMDPNVTNDQEYCYRIVAVDRNGFTSGTTNLTCVVPRSDPIVPTAGIAINEDAPTTSSNDVTLALHASDTPADDGHAYEDGIEPEEGAISSGVADMLISNRPDFAGADWEPYALMKGWTVQPKDQTAIVYFKVRDAAGNESTIESDAIRIVDQPAPSSPELYLPLIHN